MPGINIGGDDVTEITIDGEQVTEVTMDGDVVWTAPTDEPTEPAYLESFEHNDLAGNYQGNFSDTSMTDAWSWDGTYSMVNDGSTGNDGVLSIDDVMTAGRDVHYRFAFHIEGGPEGYPVVPVFARGVEYTNYSGYSITFALTGDGSFWLNRENNGSSTRLVESDVNWTAGGTYIIDFFPESNGSLTLTCYDDTMAQLAQITATDSTYTNGQIGFGGNVFGTSAYIDAFGIVGAPGGWQ